jgi:fluoroquinolone transport system ATP-binding protein
MISVNHLTYSYPHSKQPVLLDVSFEIAEGEIFGFLGPSGAGKSTTQKIFYKVLEDYGGEVQVRGKPLKSWGTDYFENIGVGFELPNHYLKLTARENMQLFSSFYRKERLLDVEELFDALGLLEHIDQRVEEFSKGMKMRLNFIRAILHNPDVLFFDEPTSGLDPVNARKVKDAILKLKNQGKTIFVTTHDMTTAEELCDRVSFLVEGQIRLTERPSVLRKKYGRHIVRVVLQDQKTAEFPLQDLAENREFLDFLSHGDILSINSLGASLEEVFIQVTGTSLAQ